MEEAQAKDPTAGTQTRVEGNMAAFSPASQFGEAKLDPDSDQAKALARREEQEKQKALQNAREEESASRSGATEIWLRNCRYAPPLKRKNLNWIKLRSILNLLSNAKKTVTSTWMIRKNM
ncbi:MAG: hypothetical protein R3C11_25485 [Planctomycetaceae bacterium]